MELIKKIIFMICMITCGMFLLYSIKTLLGIDIFPDMDVIDFLEFVKYCLFEW